MLSDQFLASGGTPIQVDGNLVHAGYTVENLQSCEFSVSMARGSRWPQALCVAIVTRAGVLEVNGERSKRFALWTVSAPSLFEVAVRTRSRVDLRLWNAWRIGSSVEHAGTDNSGMLVERDGDEVILRCSDGYGAIDFTDLVVSIEFTKRDIR